VHDQGLGMRTVALFGCPRSGTSWLGQLLHHHPRVMYRYQPLFAYEFKDWFGRHGLHATSVRDFHAALAHAQSDFVLQDLRPAKPVAPDCLVWKEVRFHQLMAPLLATGELDHLIYLFRKPVDMLNSWYQAPKEFRAGQDIRAEYLHAPSKNTDPSEFNGLARWKTSMQMALQVASLRPRQVSLLSYERLRQAPGAQMSRLLQRIGLSDSEAVGRFITESTSRQETDAYSVFRAQPAPLALPHEVIEAVQQDQEAAALLQSALSRCL
jgi:hypothetical protein